MHGLGMTAASAVVVAVVVASTASLAQQAAPKVEQEAQKGAQPAGKMPADPVIASAPDQLRGKSVIISYFETRVARPEGGGKADTRRAPFTLTLYISKEKHAFNRLSPGRAGNSDQVRGARDDKGSTASRDITGFATRDVAFDGLKMTVTNAFGARHIGCGTGKREISATFDADYTKCTGNVVTTVEGEYTRRRLMKGGFEELLSATNDGFTCEVRDGNALAPSS